MTSSLHFYPQIQVSACTELNKSMLVQEMYDSSPAKLAMVNTNLQTFIPKVLLLIHHNTFKWSHQGTVCTCLWFCWYQPCLPCHGCCWCLFWFWVSYLGLCSTLSYCDRGWWGSHGHHWRRGGLSGKEDASNINYGASQADYTFSSNCAYGEGLVCITICFVHGFDFWFLFDYPSVQH